MVQPYLCLPGQSRCRECRSPASSQHSYRFTIIIHHFEIQIFIVLSALHLASGATFLCIKHKPRCGYKNTHRISWHRARFGSAITRLSTWSIISHPLQASTPLGTKQRNTLNTCKFLVNSLHNFKCSISKKNWVQAQVKHLIPAQVNIALMQPQLKLMCPIK